MKDKKGLPWTDEEINFLRENCNKMTMREMAAYLGRTIDSVNTHMQTFKARGMPLEIQEQIMDRWRKELE